MSAVLTPPRIETQHHRASTRTHPGRAALLLLMAWPVLGIAAYVWRTAMLTEGDRAMHPDEILAGVAGAVRDLPAELVAVALALVGVLLGVRAARLGARRGVAAIWLHAAALLLALLLFRVGDPSNAVKVWTSLPGAALAAGMLVVALRAARPAAVPARYSQGRLRTAAAVAGVGIVASFVWLYAAQAALTSHANGFARTSEGQIGLRVGHAGTYHVYEEPSPTGAGLVAVTDPAGRNVALRYVASEPVYVTTAGGVQTPTGVQHPPWPGWVGRTAATFVAPAPGVYTLSGGGFAVGDDVTGWLRPHELGVAVLLTLTVAGGVALAVTARQTR